MKKPLFAALVLCLTLSACLLPTSLQQPIASNDNGNTPQVNIQETAEVMAATMAAQTIAALPTPTLVPPNKVATISPIATFTVTIDPNIMVTTTMLTFSITGTAVTNSAKTATSLPATKTPTFTSGGVMPTETLHVRYYGTLPPYLPYGSILLSNRSKAEAYISLQCTTKDGFTTILEYPVKGNYGINAPAGHYTYVAWVGGNKMEGKFVLGIKQELTVTLYKDSVGIK